MSMYLYGMTPEEAHDNYIEEKAYKRGYEDAKKELDRPHGSWEGTPERKPLITRKCTACGESSAVGYFCMWCGSNNQVEVGDSN